MFWYPVLRSDVSLLICNGYLLLSGGPVLFCDGLTLLCGKLMLLSCGVSVIPFLRYVSVMYFTMFSCGSSVLLLVTLAQSCSALHPPKYLPPDLLPHIKGSHDLNYKKVNRFLCIVVWHMSVHSLARGHVIRV